jgi:hypothetical protein
MTAENEDAKEESNRLVTPGGTELPSKRRTREAREVFSLAFPHLDDEHVLLFFGVGVQIPSCF